MSDLKLLPCPFCGGEARYMEIKDFFISRFVTCTKCGIETPRNCLNRKDAVKRWNTRKPIDDIRNKAIDDFFETLQEFEDDDMWLRLKISSIYEIAEQLKARSDDNEVN